MNEIENSAEIVADFQAFAKQSNEALGKRIKRIKDDLEFASGKPFIDEDTADDKRKGLVNIGFNFLRNYFNQIINPFREKPYGIILVNKKGDDQGAKMLQAIVRGIEHKSKANQSYVTAFDRSVKCGHGYFGITTDYTSDTGGFEQDIKIVPIVRPDMVIDDPFSISVDGSDARKRALVEHIPEDQAKEQFGADVVAYQDKDMACSLTQWEAPKGSVAVVTYYKLKTETRNIYGLEDGTVLDEANGKVKDSQIKGAKTRQVKKTSCSVYKIVGRKCVSETTLPCSIIPVIAVRGELVDLDNRNDFVGITHYGKPVVRAMNYSISEAVTRLLKAPRSLYTMDAKSVADYHAIIKSNAPIKYLPYNSRDPQNPDITYPAPQLLNASVDVSDMNGMFDRFKADLSSVLGMSEAGANLSGANKTAAEVLTKSKSQDLSNLQYSSNMAESIKLGARVIIQLLGSIYDTERNVMIDEDGKVSTVKMNIAQDLPIDPESIGIEVDAGPMSETSKKEELFKTLAIADMVDEADRKKLVPSIIRLSELENSEKLAKQLETNGAGAEEALQSAEQAVSSLEQANAAMTEQLNQMNLYVQQLQGENASLKSDMSVAIYKANLDYKKAIDVETIKQDGNLTVEQLKIQADAEKELQDSRQKVMEAIASKPEITIVKGASPEMPAIQGQRNDIFKV